MTIKSHPKVYDSIGEGYCNYRTPDPRIAKTIRDAMQGCQSICNVGAGSGSYEPEGLQVTAVEPSQKMIDQRTSDARVVCAKAESLPFEDNSFDATMAVLTVHHWLDPVAGLKEMQRVSARQVIFAFDVDWLDSLWMVRDYLPEIIDFDKERSVSIDLVAKTLNAHTIMPVPIPYDCIDGFQAAYWRRPEYYLNPKVRQAISTFAQLDRQIVERAMNQLEADLQSGAWHKQNAESLNLEEMDFGYRLIVAGD